MKKEDLLESLMFGRKIAEKLRKRAIIKRLLVLFLLLFFILMITLLIQSLYQDIVLGNENSNYLATVIIVVFYILLFSFVFLDIYNPLKKVGKFNYQFFVLTELIISELKREKTRPYNLQELIILFKKYLFKMYEHAGAIYIFENDEIIKIISKFSGLSFHKIYELCKNNKIIMIEFLNCLSSLYECKINQKPYNAKVYAKLLNYLDQINNSEISKERKLKSRMYRISDYIRKNSKKSIVILFIVVLGTVGIVLKIGGVNDTTFNEYFLYLLTVVSAVLAIISWNNSKE